MGNITGAGETSTAAGGGSSQLTGSAWKMLSFDVMEHIIRSYTVIELCGQDLENFYNSSKATKQFYGYFSTDPNRTIHKFFCNFVIKSNVRFRNVQTNYLEKIGAKNQDIITSVMKHGEYIEIIMQDISALSFSKTKFKSPAKSLNLAWNEMDWNAVEMLIQRCPRIEQLNLTRNLVLESKSFSNILSRCRHLHTLILFGVSKMQTLSITTQDLQQCPELEHLNIGLCRLKTNISALWNYRPLKKLVVAENSLRTHHLVQPEQEKKVEDYMALRNKTASISAELQFKFCQNFTLQDLDISHNLIKDEGVEIISNTLLGLVRLSVCNTGITNTGFRTLLHHRSFTNLLLLDVRFNSISELPLSPSAEDFPKTLAVLKPLLQSLYISGCELDTHDLLHILEHPSLHSLKIDHNPIDMMNPQLKEAFSRNMVLREVLVDEKMVPPEQLENCFDKKALSRMMVVYYNAIQTKKPSN